MKNKRKLLTAIIVVALIAIFSSGCLNQQPEKQGQTPAPGTEEQDKTTKKPGQFFPLALGTTWEYQGEGNEFASFTREVIFASGDRYQTREDTGGTVMAMIYRVTDESVTRIYSEGEVYENINLLDKEPNENTIILKSPLKVGTKWQRESGNCEITDIDASVETPAGKFDNCIEVKITGQNSTIYEYYKGGIGLVSREFSSEETKVSSRLKKFTPPS